jgi:hypothetical protein
MTAIDIRYGVRSVDLRQAYFNDFGANWYLFDSIMRKSA